MLKRSLTNFVSDTKVGGEIDNQNEKPPYKKTLIG